MKQPQGNHRLPVTVKQGRLLPGIREAWPGLLAIIVIALVVGLPGISLKGLTLTNGVTALDKMLPTVGGRTLLSEILHLNYVLLALLSGIIIRNVIGMPKSWAAGVSYNAILYKTGIVLLGSQYVMSDMVKLGPVAMAIVTVFVFGTAYLVLWLGKWYKAPDSMTGTLAGGCAVCGVSATVATAPMVGGKTTEMSYAIATILGFGLVCLFVMPYVGHWLGLSEYEYGVWAATGILNSAQVIASGFMYGPEAGKVAGFVNMGRVVLLPLACLFTAFMIMTRNVYLSGRKLDSWQIIKDKFPVFVIGFIIMWLANSAGMFSAADVRVLNNVMTWFFTLGFVGLGLGTNLSDLRKTGGVPLAIGVLAGTAKVLLSLLAIIAASKMGWLK